VLVYNAAGAGGPLTRSGPDALRRASEVNLHSLVEAVTVLLPQLQQTRGTVLVTGGGLALHPASAVGILSVGKAMTRAAALVLAEELEPLGVAVRTVTIAGTVEPGGPFDPQRIARTYLALHRREIDGPEVVFTADTTVAG
jgi:NADP-dependent 3-hydroxy acid dehydrogenase YdfG